jgi:GMP synthase-like glutamine amidotransferase
MKPPLTAAVLTHVPHEGPGAIAPYLFSHGTRVVEYPVYQGASVPGPGSIGLLIVMGGPMSVNDAARLPWLGPEIEAIANHLHSGTPVLGICLGAQLIAAALGSRVLPSGHTEVGWWPVGFHSPEGNPDPWRSVFSGRPFRMPVFHWHGETFDLPRTAVIRASSTACRNQAFTVGDRVVGLQFHLEMTTPGIAAIADASSSDIGGGTYKNLPTGIDPGASLLRISRDHTGWGRPLLHAILAHLEQITLR